MTEAVVEHIEISTMPNVGPGRDVGKEHRPVTTPKCCATCRFFSRVFHVSRGEMNAPFCVKRQLGVNPGSLCEAHEDR